MTELGGHKRVNLLMCSSLIERTERVEKDIINLERCQISQSVTYVSQVGLRERLEKLLRRKKSLMSIVRNLNPIERGLLQPRRLSRCQRCLDWRNPENGRLRGENCDKQPVKDQ